ncbi:MAG: hypothetical protein QOK04_2311 [Solirubrobacteraceae bacterium]|nr:hypothetical protein [Solirubrobacteraceae bacterium]
MSRSRTITWEDPVATAARAAEMSGLDYVKAIGTGDVPPPPIAVLMDFRPVEVEEGRAVFAVTPAEFHYNPIGVVHGGLAATLLDSAMGCAVQTTLPTGIAYTTLEVKVNFARPMTRDTGRVLAEANVVHRGRTVATAEGRVFAEDSGKLVAHGTTTCLLFSSNGAGNGNDEPQPGQSR